VLHDLEPLALFVLAIASILGAGALAVIASEIRGLRPRKLRKPFVDFLTEGKAAAAVRVMDANKSDRLLEDLHAVTAFAKFGVETYDAKLRGGQTATGAPPSPAPPAPIPSSGVAEFLQQGAVRVERPPSDGTSSAS
jgi:hypothetical protein